LRKEKIALLFLPLLFAAVHTRVSAQSNNHSLVSTVAPDSVLGIVDSSVVKTKHYIRFSKNRINVNGDSSDLMRFFKKYDSLINFHDRQLSIYHFGGSHIQADYYSHRMRNHFQSLGECMHGARGWIFPFPMVKTNNPANYKVSYTGNWKGVRCPVKPGFRAIAWFDGDLCNYKRFRRNIKNL
jgi:hypothetical protein